MDSVQINLNKKSSPKDGQRLLFKIAINNTEKGEGNEKYAWYEGYYSANSKGIYTIKGEFYREGKNILEWLILPDGHLFEKEQQPLLNDQLIFTKDFLLIYRSDRKVK